MKIAFLFNRLRVSRGDGIVSQAFTWKKILENRGHQVDLTSSWNYVDYSEYDIVQLFGKPINLLDDVRGLETKTKNIVIAPIFDKDPHYSFSTYKIFSRFGSEHLRTYNNFYALRRIRNSVKGCLVRSQYELYVMRNVFGYDSEKCKVVMLSNGTESVPFSLERDNFCLHISRLGATGKNVKRLIDASEKYQFRLVLGGMLKESEKAEFDSWMKGKHYAEYLGYLSDEKKHELCMNAKVFALPSFIEGVGLAALEAATLGCDVVITNIGGPKEYFNGLAKTVDPYSVDEIGKAVRFFLDGNTFQPKLSEHIITNYSDDNVVEKLEKVYMEFVKGK
ncbi:MAG: glycosyltransferase family 4 protein [Prevotella sp.]|nr:glycosyltransferase family 4 protein [Prevotella sp.]